MAKIPALDAVRIIPRDTDFLDRRSGNRGEIFYDRTANTLRLYDGSTASGINLAKSDLTNVSNAAFVAKATAAGIGSGSIGGGSNFELTIAADDSTIRTIISGNVLKFTGGDGISTVSSEDGEVVIASTTSSFTTIAVSGQSNIVADQISDTLTLAAGANITITTDADTDTITISAAGGEGGSASDSFSTIAVSGQSNVVADSATDTLTLVAGNGITIATNAGADSITITNNVSTFNQLADAVLSSTTVDKIYLPAITMLAVTNSGASAYRFDQYGANNNPTIYAINGTTIAFNLTATDHPFLIQNGAGINYNTGLIHVATDGTVSTGASAQGKDSGTLYWKIPTDISGGYRYQCSIHAPMVGSISIKTFATI
jgi:plastocyanin